MAVTYQVPKLSMKENRLVLHCPFADGMLAKSVAGVKWDPVDKSWNYPVRPEVIEELHRFFPHMAVDGSAQDSVRDVSTREAAARHIKDTDDVIDVEMPVKGTPYIHQKKAFKISTLLPNVAYLMEPGCGKTLTTIATAGHHWKNNGLRRLLVLAPASVVPVWPKEFADFAAFPAQVIALQGDSKHKEKALLTFGPPGEALQVAVINYESAWRIEEALAKWIRGGMIACDESQRIKTPGATQSKCLHKLGPLASYRLILTGTPVTQSPLDFFSQYKFLQPDIFGTNFTAFKARYAIEVPLTKDKGKYGPKKIVGFQKIHELIAKAHSIAFRITKAEALDLPDETTQPLFIELNKDTKRIYNELRREAITELESGTVTAQNVLTKLLRLSQLTGGHLTDEAGETHKVSSEKMEVFEETLDDLLDAGKKVVVFARFVAEIKSINRALELRGIGYRYISGEVPISSRGQVVKDFQEDPEVRVFVAQIQTAGLGITLTAADTAIFYSMDFSMANHEQALARIHRIGQRFPVTYIYLLAQGTVDEQIYKSLKEKKNVADTVVDRWREFM